ncbi:MAG: hypothetical protein IKL59_00595 [Clostridia bacterium]|nr:hypothetical protein [Clostridia bacterium]
MKKEVLKFDYIKQDLTAVVNCMLNYVEDWRWSYIFPTAALSLMLGFLLKNVFVGLVIFIFPAYHIVRYIMAFRRLHAKKKEIINAISRSDIAISVKQLSHISEETIYEPHQSGSGRGVNSTKEVIFFCFEGGNRWRVPMMPLYSWSRDYHLSPTGLENISLAGDEFFYVSLQGHHDISYIYPCKFFELDSSLKTPKSYE